MHQVSLEDYCLRLRSDLQQGLSPAEALLRLRRDGPNLLVQRRRESELLKFLRQLTNLFAILLWSGTGLCLVAEYLTPGEGNMAIAIALVGVVILNGSFSYWQGRRAEEIMASFRDMLQRLARVVRDGVVHEIPAAELVRGDLILLAEGDTRMEMPAPHQVFEL